MINVKVQIEILYLHEAGLRGFSLCLIQNLQFVTCYIDALKNLWNHDTLQRHRKNNALKNYVYFL